MSLQDKLTYLVETKRLIKNAIINKGIAIEEGTPFRSYPTLINSIQGGSAGEGFELYKVMNVTKSGGIATISVTGFGYFGDPEYEDEVEYFEHFNGKYVQTEDTIGLEGFDRKFKHETEDIWIKGYIDEEDWYGYDFWYFVTEEDWPVDNYDFIIDDSELGPNLPNGRKYCHNQNWGDDFECNFTSTEEASSPALVEGKKVSEIISGGIYLTEGELITLDYDFEPKRSYVYPTANSKIISKNGIQDYSYGYPVDQDTVAFYDFEDFSIENGILKATGVGAQDFGYVISGQVTNGSSLDNGYIGKGWNLNGDYFCATATGKKQEFRFTSDFTVEAMLYPTTTDRQCFFSYVNDGKFGICFSYDGDAKFAVFGTEEEGWSPLECSPEIELNNWYHIAVQRKNGKFQFFVDLVKTKEADISNINFAEDAGTNNLPYFGRWGGDPGDFGARWKGYIDQIRISKVARY